MIKFQDRATVGTVNDTQDGYRVAMSRIARAGVQDYLASEVGLVGSHTVRVMRPEKEVFDKATFASLSHAPVTIGHPSELVDSANWKTLAVGEVGEGVLRDGEWIAAPLILKDAAAIKASKTTHKEISMGYSATLIDAPAGADYDLEMTDIRFNHLALVPAGRAGSKARIGDAATNWGAAPLTTKESAMDMTKVVIGDKAVQVAATDADTVTKMMTDNAAAIVAKDTEIGELKAKLADAESKVLTDAQLADKVKAMADAKAKRDAVAAKFGDEMVKDASESQIEGMFKVLDKSAAKDDTMRSAIGDMKGKKPGSAWDKFMPEDKKGKK